MPHSHPDSRPTETAGRGLGRSRPGGKGEVCADPQTLAVLELDRLLDRVASLAQSPLGADLARSLRPSSDIRTVERRQRRLDQLRELLSQSSPPSLSGLVDLSPILARLAAAGAFLQPAELEQTADFLGAAGRAAAFLDPSEDNLDELFRLRNRITPLNELARRVRAVVGPGGSVKSSASPELARIRRELARSRDRLRGQLERLMARPEMAGVFSDQVVTQRADRFVAPVKTDAKGRVKGIIHDTSGSGATCFMEPLEAVEGNNQLALLRRREQEEEERVLLELSAEMAVHRQVLGENLQALAKLDCLLAQAAFCDRLDACRPELNTNGELDLRRVRHPLLAWRSLNGRGRAAPVDIRLGAEAPVLVISGANAGGKTAALKTAGLISLMVMCGLAAPCAPGSRAAVFREVMAELGDEQDLGLDLSTFTAHAGRLARMVRRAGPGSLILVDELGAGTDPGEGSALGMAVLQWFLDRGARVMCTTHFHRLKAFAASAQGVENVSVAFDRDAGQAAYQLAYGRPGFSDALAVSRGLGFPPEIIARAEQEVDAGERRTVALLRRAEEDRRRAEAMLLKAQAQGREAEDKLRQAREALREARRKRAQARDEGKRRVRQVARCLEDRLEELWKETSRAMEAEKPPRPGTVRQKVYQARRQALSQVDQALTPERTEQTPPPAGLYQLEPGDPVRLLNLNQRGVILEKPRPGKEVAAVGVGVGGVRVLVPLNEMAPLPPGDKPQAEPTRVSVWAEAGDGLDLKLIGLRVDDALPLVDKALDQAILSGRDSMRIVHGVGAGRLRQAVREYLRNHPQVVRARSPQGRGSAGVTVAELRR